MYGTLHYRSAKNKMSSASAPLIALPSGRSAYPHPGECYHALLMGYGHTGIYPIIGRWAVYLIVDSVNTQQWIENRCILAWFRTYRV